MQTFLKKYGAAAGHVVIALTAALVAVLDKPVTLVVGIQLGIVALNAVTTYLVPLTNAKWQAGWKVGAAVAGTLLAGLVPLLVQGTLTGQNLLVLVFAAVGVLAAQLGVDHRTDASTLTATDLSTFNITNVATPADIPVDVSRQTAPADPNQPAAGTPPQS